MTKLIVDLHNLANAPKKQGTFLSNVPRSPTEHCFSGTLPVFTRLSICQRQNVDEERGALLEWDRQGKIKVLWETPVPEPFFTPHITHGLRWDRIRAFALRGRWSISVYSARTTQRKQCVSIRNTFGESCIGKQSALRELHRAQTNNMWTKCWDFGVNPGGKYSNQSTLKT